MSESTAADVAPQAPKSGRTPGLMFIFITMLLDIIGIGIVIPVGPRLVAQLAHGDLSSTSTIYGLVAALYTATQFLCGPFLGALSDRFGRKPILLGSLMLTAIGNFITGTAPVLGVLFLGRALAGLGGASLTVATTYIADVTSPEKRASAFGLLGVAFGLGFILGPAIGGLLGGFGIAVPFLAASAVAVLNLLYGLAVVPESHPRERRGAFVWAAANPIGTLGRLGRYAMVRDLAIAMLWFNLAQNFLQSNWVVYTGYRFNWDARLTGMSLAVVGLGAAIVQGGLIRVLIPKLGERRAVVAGMTMHALSLLAYGLATQGWMMFAILVVGSLAGIAGPALQAQISKRVTAQEQGSVQGALSSLNSLTGIVGPIVSTGIFQYFTSAKAPVQIPGAAFIAGSMLSGIGLLILLKVFATHPEMPAAEAAPAEAAPAASHASGES